jgi:dehydrogenase/reductase SDR family member 7B
MDENVFRDRIAWITGASSGIGAALAERLAEAGGRLILSAEDEVGLHRVAERLSARARVMVLPLDLAKVDSLAACAEKALACFGGLDLLFHNAGVSQRELAENTKLDIDRRIMEINYFGPLALTKAVLPYFLSRRAGHFVVVSSMAGKIGSPWRSAYAASKHALHGFFDSLRAEVAARGVRVTLVCPGFVHTNISVNALCGDGRVHGIMDPKNANAMSPLCCADRILRAVARRKNEAYVGRSEIAMIYLDRWFPNLYKYLASRIRVT